MIGYVTLGTNDIEKAADFYDDLLSLLGAGRMMEEDGLIVWGTGMGRPALSVIKPYDGQPATVGNGVMVALAVDSNEMVDEMHAKAMSLGAVDEGTPGERTDNFYGAYFRDSDGNKLAVFHYSA